MPDIAPEMGWLTEQPFAHRGLHYAETRIPENSLASVCAAIDAGYGIEIDIQAAADGTPVVFHDEKLYRMTGQSGLIKEMAPADITRVALKNSDEKIPTLADTLNVVVGRTPILIEIKHHHASDGSFENAVLETVQDYDGPFALMSFDPSALMHLKAQAPNVPRGLISEAYRLHPFSPHISTGERLCRHLMLHAFRTAPHFIAYHWRDLRNPFLRMAMLLNRKPLLAWTVRKPEDADIALARRAQQIIFEDFHPVAPRTQTVHEPPA